MTASTQTVASAEGTVRRRRVFFICGFDPQGPAHYHRLYAEQAARQAEVSGYRIEVGPRSNDGAQSSSWTVRWREEHADRAGAETTLEFLRWDDIVRAHWERRHWRVMLETLASTAHQVRNGVLWRILKTSWPAFLVLVMPPVLVVCLMAWGVATLALALLALRWLDGPAGLASGAAVTGLGMTVAGVVLSAWACVRFAAWAQARVQMAWLMRSTRFILAQARGGVPALEQRLDGFARRIIEAGSDPGCDEILVVGHSSGAMLAVSAVARALRLESVRAPPLSLLTLGECIPMLSYQPEAAGFRAELETLVRSRSVDWIDFTAPPDGCCFALVDPTAVCAGQDEGADRHPPKRLSPRFAQLFPAPEYALIRRDKYRCHFQYLMAGGLPSVYDFFAITAGPLRLERRFRTERSVDDFREFQVFGGVR